MSVIISNGNTSLNTPNGFYRVEASQLGSVSTNATQVLSTLRPISLTFANAGNALGVVLCMYNVNTAANADVVVDLEQSLGTVTTSIANPCLVTLNGHGLADGQQVRFSTTGALPTNISNTGKYYVINSAPNTFNISLTVGGAAIITSGTQSGTHTLWAMRATSTLTTAQIDNSTNKWGVRYVPFPFTAPYAVDTVASKWRLGCYGANGTTHWTLGATDATANTCFYAVWCDNQVSFTNDDILICKDVVTVDKTATLGSVAVSGSTSHGVSGIICASNDLTTPLLVWENPALASYTLTIKGVIYLGNHSIVQIGTEANPISASNPAILDFSTMAIGTTQSSFSSNAFCHGIYFKVYGEVPACAFTTLAQDGIVGTNTIVTTDDTGWVVGDKLVIGKQDTSNQGDTTTYEIQAISGVDITLTSNILTNKRLTGATVLRIGSASVSAKYGVRMINNTAVSSNNLYGCNAFVLKGVELENFSFFLQSSYVQYADPIENRSQYLFEDCVGWSILTGGGGHILRDVNVPNHGCLLNRVYTSKCQLNNYIYTTRNTVNGIKYSSGAIEFRACRSLMLPWNGINGNTATTFSGELNINHCVFENQSAGGATIAPSGVGLTLTDNEFWGCNSSERGVIYMHSLINPKEIARNKYNKCYDAIRIHAGATIGCIDRDSIFGDEAANVNSDVFIGQGVYMDYEFASPTGDLVIDKTYLPDSVIGSALRVTDANNVTNADSVIKTFGYLVRTGDGLTDTTVRTAGSGKFAVRFEPTSSTDNLDWQFNVPTGDIQSKTMTVSVWVKINNAAYYAGTHEKPRLTINFDNGTTAYAEALANTDWQLLAVPFTPTTAYGQITVTVSGKTDATGSNAYFYIDDFGVAYPPSVALDLGGLDNFAHGLPVTPPIALPLSAQTVAQSVWQQLTTTSWGTGTMGEKNKAVPGKIQFINDGELPIY